MLLRPYQERAVEALRHSYATGHRAPLLQMPTGAGKTIIFCEIAAGARAKGRRTLVVAHRRELIKQAADKLTDAGVACGIICPGFCPVPGELVQVASIQTLARQLDMLLPYDLIVFDEAHHCVAGQCKALIEAQPTAKLLGLTATPHRLDGKGLGVEAGGVFDDLITGPSIAALVADGYLVAARCFVPAQRLDLTHVAVRDGDYAARAVEALVNKATITGDAIEQYRRHADHLPAICFCASVVHAERVARTFREAGYRAVCAHGGMAVDKREMAIAGWTTGEVEVLTSCDLISEGLDVPVVGAVILLRPTKSLALHLQQIGRGLRPAPGKGELIVLDHAGNVIEHGLPETHHDWCLTGAPKYDARTGNGGPPPVWRCECGCVNTIDCTTCVDCDASKPGRTVEQVAGDLVALTPNTLAYARHWTFPEMARGRRSEAELREFAGARGYHLRWVEHRLREQTQRMAGAVR